MTKEQLAALLNGREYGSEISKEEAERAREAGLVVAFAYSDDNLEMRGAINEEYGCFNGGEIVFFKDGLSPDEYEREVLEKFGCTAGYNTINAIWQPENEEGKVYASWAYDTEIPHATFNIMEDRDLFCCGIVFHIDDLK